MKASILDLRRKMKDVIYALDHNESVTIYHRGKEKGVIYPAHQTDIKTMLVSEHPSFGMWAKDKKTKNVKKHIDELRKSRYDI